jgi:hypothetical protein
MKADIDLDIGRKTFASGLLPELIGAVRRCRPGYIVALTGEDDSLGTELADSPGIHCSKPRSKTVGRGLSSVTALFRHLPGMTGR